MRLRLILAVLIFTLLSFNLSALELTKNPYRAMLFSALLPGGGQVYNNSYFKAVAVIGLQAYLVNSAVYDYNKREHFKDLTDGSGSSADLFNQGRFEHYDKNLKSDYWWIGTVLVLSMADAFVDAHLDNYNAEKKKVHLKFEDKQMSIELQF